MPLNPKATLKGMRKMMARHPGRYEIVALIDGSPALRMLWPSDRKRSRKQAQRVLRRMRAAYHGRKR
jgi:hypothetical protein